MITIREILARTYRDLAATAKPDDQPRQETLDLLARTVAHYPEDPEVSEVERTIEETERGQ